MSRKRAEIESKEDLNKSYEQLLTDIHEELLNKKREQVDNIRHALKRVASFFAKRELENEKIQRRMNCFTIVVGIFTIINVIVFLIDLFINCL